MTVDDNALPRQPEVAEMRNPSAEDPQEQMAKERGITYVKLDGEIGILGNGAGLVMSTLDVVAQAGGRPANFLDVGGGAKAEEIVAALEVLLSDPKVKAVLFNIFGGITRCDEVANGILQALDQIDVQVPIVVRLDGTNDEEGRRILAEADAPQLHPAKTMLEAAEMVVETGEGRSRGVVAILVDQDTKLAISGLTGRQGQFHGKRNKEYGTDLVAGVTPGKEGEQVEGVPVFNTMHKAVAETGANTAMVFVPPPFAADAIYEAADAGIGTIICITEGIPAHDMLRVYNYLKGTDSRLIGPNCPGVLSPGKANVGIIPADFFSPGGVGLVSRSGTLTYQIGYELAQLGVGNSTIVGIGGDPIIGSSFIDVIALFEQDPETELIVMVGEIGGDEEERTAEYIGEHVIEAGGRLHRGLPGAARQAHGPRRRDHLRLVRAPRRRRPRRWRRRASRSGATRPRLRSWRRRRSGRRLSRRSRRSRRRLSSSRVFSRPDLLRSRAFRAPTYARRGVARGRRSRAARGPRRARWPMAPGRATRRCASGSPSATASSRSACSSPTGRSRPGCCCSTPWSSRATRWSSRRRRTTARCSGCSARGAELTAVPLEDDGIDVAELERAAGRRPAAEADPHDPELPQPGRVHAVAREARAAGRSLPRSTTS